jgi:aryl-alcohol dehydrogenase-like predicted oxidoreductase
MRHRLLGGSGLRVSELCLGTMTFGEQKGWGSDASAADAILAAFADAGGTFIDTAPNYAGGVAEEIVGRFLAGRRDDFAVATKFTASPRAHPLAGGNSRKALRSSVEASLNRLGTDHIDLLWLHFWDGTSPLDEIVRGLDDLVSAGKILYWGFSDTPAWLVSRAAAIAELRGRAGPIATQIEYNVGARTPERELLPMADALDLGVVCWGPLGAGALVGGSLARFAGAKLAPGLAAAAQAVEALATQSGIPASTLALRWLLERGHVPLVGARTREQITASLAALEIEVAVDVLARLDAVAPPEPGFPHGLIGSSYLRRLALGNPGGLAPPRRARA